MQKKAFDKIQQPIMIKKKLNKSGCRGNMPQNNKSCISQTYSQQFT